MGHLLIFCRDPAQAKAATKTPPSTSSPKTTWQASCRASSASSLVLHRTSFRISKSGLAATSFFQAPLREVQLADSTLAGPGFATSPMRPPLQPATWWLLGLLGLKLACNGPLPHAAPSAGRCAARFSCLRSTGPAAAAKGAGPTTAAAHSRPAPSASLGLFAAGSAAGTFRPPSKHFRPPSGRCKPVSAQPPATSTGSVLFLPQWLDATVGSSELAVQRGCW